MRPITLLLGAYHCIQTYCEDFRYSITTEEMLRSMSMMAQRVVKPGLASK